MDSANRLATFSLTRLPARDLRLRLQMIGGGVVKALREGVFFLLMPSIELQRIQRRYGKFWIGTGKQKDQLSMKRGPSDSASC